MTRQEYLDELDSNLISLPKEEREMAVRFYEEYFEDAGPENEQSVMDDLGKPFVLAKSIICEESAYSKSISYAKYRESKSIAVSSPFTSGQGADTAQDVMPGSVKQEQDVMPSSGSEQIPPHTQYTAFNYGETGSASQPQQEETYPNAEASSGGFNYNGAADREPNAGQSGEYEQYKQNYTANEVYPTTSSSSDKTLILILGIILFLALLPVIATLIATFAACAVGAVGCFIGAIACAFVTIGSIANGPLALFFFLGITAVCLGLGFLFSSVAIAGFGRFTPWAFKTFSKFIKKHSGGIK